MIENCVKIYCYSKEALKDRIYFSDGTEKAFGMYKDVEYDLKSHKAKKPWKSFSQKELNTLFLDEPSDDFRGNIGVARIPDELRINLKKLKINNFSSSEQFDLIRLEHPQEFKKLIKSLGEYISDFLISDKKISVTGFTIGRPNIETATIGRGKYAGLHIDIWDRLSLSDLSTKSTNRMSINMGREDRFLLFVNLTLNLDYALKLRYEDRKCDKD